MGYWDETLRWGFDWMMKAHPSADVLYVQVGDGKVDNNYWVGEAEQSHGRVTLIVLLHIRAATRRSLPLDLPSPSIEAVQEPMQLQAQRLPLRLELSSTLQLSEIKTTPSDCSSMLSAYITLLNLLRSSFIRRAWQQSVNGTLVRTML